MLYNKEQVAVKTYDGADFEFENLKPKNYHARVGKALASKRLHSETV